MGRHGGDPTKDVPLGEAILQKIPEFYEIFSQRGGGAQWANLGHPVVELAN